MVGEEAGSQDPLADSPGRPIHLVPSACRSQAPPCSAAGVAFRRAPPVVRSRTNRRPRSLRCICETRKAAEPWSCLASAWSVASAHGPVIRWQETFVLPSVSQASEAEASTSSRHVPLPHAPPSSSHHTGGGNHAHIFFFCEKDIMEIFATANYLDPSGGLKRP